MSLTIVRAGTSHLDLLAPLFDAYRQFYAQPADPEGARAFLADLMREGASVVFLARDGERGLGFTQLYPLFSSVAMRRVWILNDLFVAPEGRRQGVARALMERARRHAAETGAARLELATASDNGAAQALYEALGYERETGFLHYALNV